MPSPFRDNSFLGRFQSTVRGVFGGPEQRSLPPPVGVTMGTFGSPFTFKPKQSLEAADDNVWLDGAVRKIAFQVAKTDFKLRRKLTSKDKDIRYVEKHQALAALAKPQPSGQKSLLTAFDLKFVTTLHLLLAGESFWVLDRRMNPQLGGSPTRIDIARPDLMYPRPDVKTGDLLGYTYRPGQTEIEFPLEDVVHFRLPDALNPYRGHSPTKPLRYSLDTHFEADLLNLKRIQNNAVPAGLLKPEQSITEDQSRRLRTQWQQLYGGSENAGKLAVLPGKMDFQELQLNNQELQFLEGKAANRDEVLAAFGVGLEMFGKTESQTRANAETAVYVFMLFGVSPFLFKFNDSLNNDFLTTFAGSDGLEFCFDDPVPENAEEKRANADSLFAGGALTPNERRRMFNLEPLALPGMDEPYLPFSVMPVGSSAPDPVPDPLTGSNTNTEPA